MNFVDSVGLLQVANLGFDQLVVLYSKNEESAQWGVA